MQCKARGLSEEGKIKRLIKKINFKFSKNRIIESFKNRFPRKKLVKTSDGTECIIYTEIPRGDDK